MQVCQAVPRWLALGIPVSEGDVESDARLFHDLVQLLSSGRAKQQLDAVQTFREMADDPDNGLAYRRIIVVAGALPGLVKLCQTSHSIYGLEEGALWLLAALADDSDERG